MSHRKTNATAPYSYSGSAILRRRFPQQSPGRAAVKISVQALRMKFSGGCLQWQLAGVPLLRVAAPNTRCFRRSEEHTSELQSPCNLVCRLLLEKKKNN